MWESVQQFLAVVGSLNSLSHPYVTNFRSRVSLLRCRATLPFPEINN